MKMSKFLFYDDQAINVLFLEERLSGGAAVQAHGWMQGLLSEGHEVSLITDLSQAGPVKDEAKPIDLHPMFDPEKGVRWIRWAYYRFPYLYKKIKQIKPDYLYVGIPSWHSFLYGIICRRLNIKFIQRISNDHMLDERFYKNNSKAEHFFLKWGIKLSYCVLCQNDYQLNIIKKEFPNKKVLKISNPFFLNRDIALESEQKEYIAWIDLFQYQKNLKLLYEIATLLKDEKFVVAGKASMEIDKETDTYLERLKKLPNVEFVGFLARKAVFSFLAKAKFILNTSHYEGFSNTFLEAMASGVPVISSDKVNPDSIIPTHNLGFIYRSASDLAVQLASLPPGSREIMAQNCLQFVKQRHDYQQLTKDLLNFLES